MKKVYALLLAMMSGVTILAAPSLRLRMDVIQPDKTLLTILKCGDEHLSFKTTTDGYVVSTKAGQSGFYYVTSLDSNGWQVSDSLAHNAAARGFYEKKWLLSNGMTRLVAENERVKATKAMTRVVLTAAKKCTGEVVYPVVLVNYSDVKFTVSNPVDTFTSYFNKEGFNGSGARGSVHDYFYAQSNGKYSPKFEIVATVDLPRTRAYYGAHSGSSNDSHKTELVSDAIKLAAAQGVDFSQYNDETGYVPLVAVLTAGEGENDSYVDDAVWASWNSYNIRYGKGYVKSCLVCNEIRHPLKYYTDTVINEDSTQTITTYVGADTTKTYLEGIGVFCHEFSHFLGLPDFYNTSSSESVFGMSFWSLMDYGEYWSSGNIPMGYTSYEKFYMGWLELDTLETVKQQCVLNPIGSDSVNAFVIVNDSDSNGNEFYCLENRQPSTWYPKLLGNGMLVIHVDYNYSAWSNNSVNSDPSHQRMTIIPADNSLVPESDAKPDDFRGDLFPGLMGVTSLSDETTPSFNQYNGTALGKYLTNITNEDSIVSFIYMGKGILSSPQNIALAMDENAKNLLASWDTVENAENYNITVTDGDNVVYEDTVDTNEVNLGNITGKSLVVKVVAQASDYLDSEESSSSLENPLGIESSKTDDVNAIYAVYTIDGINILNKVTAAEARRVLPKGIYILKGESGVHKIQVR